MNQILATEKKKKKSSGPSNIKSIMRFFCIFLIVFGIALAGQGTYAMISNGSKDDQKNKGTLPVVKIERDENYIVIDITHDKAISQVYYNWNGGQNEVVSGNNRTKIILDQELPVGNSTFYIRVVDVDGQEVTYTKQYVVEESDTDTTNPTIEMTVIGNNIKIVATDNKQIAYLTYRWNDEAETKIEVTPEEPEQIEAQIEIPKGENALTVIAVDSSNNTETKQQKIKGLTKPTLEITQDPLHKEYLMIKAIDQTNIKAVDYTLNGKSYRLDFGEKPIYEHWQIMTAGENKITARVYNVDGAYTDFEGVYTYTP